MSYDTALSKENITMTSTDEDLVGKIWTTGRPEEPNSPINALPMKFAGRVMINYTIHFQRLLNKIGCFIHEPTLYRLSYRP